MSALDVVGIVVTGIQVLPIAAALVYFCVRRAVWKHKKRTGKRPAGFCPSMAGMGMAFLFLQTFHRPSLAHVVEVMREEDAEDDDEGEPDTPAAHLNRQLRRIRRGEKLETLTLRL